MATTEPVMVVLTGKPQVSSLMNCWLTGNRSTVGWAACALGATNKTASVTRDTTERRFMVPLLRRRDAVDRTSVRRASGSGGTFIEVPPDREQDGRGDR